MPRLEAMRSFVRVARAGSFAAAARELRTTTATVSRRVSELEEELGVRLLQRTTRSVRMTSEGETYLQGAEGILEELRRLDDSVAGRGPSGPLRIGVGVSFGQAFLLPRLPRFLDQHPRLQVEVRMRDQHEDLIQAGLDAAIRVGRRVDSSLRFAKLTVARHVVCATPEVVARHAIREPADFSRLPCIIDLNQARSWRFDGPDGDAIEVQPKGRVAADNAHGVRALVRAGVGFALMPTFMVGEDLWNRRLVPVLDGRFEAPSFEVNLVYPGRRSVRVSALLDHLRACLDPEEPEWDRWRNAPA